MALQVAQIDHTVRFPRTELSQVYRKAIVSHRKLEPEVRKLVNFGYLYLLENADYLNANKFFHQDCAQIVNPPEAMEFPFLEFQSLSKVRLQTDLVDPLIYFGVDSLKKVEGELRAKELLDGCEKSVAGRIKYLQYIESGKPKILVDLEAKLNEELNHYLNQLCNLRHLFTDKELCRVYIKLDFLLTQMNIKTPHVEDLDGLRNFQRELISGNLDNAIQRYAKGIVYPKSSCFWSG